MTAPPTTAPPLPGTTALTEGHLACLACGVAVPPARQAEVIRGDLLGYQRPTRDDVARESQVAIHVWFTRCRPCARRDELAGSLLDRHPSVLHRLGPAVARHRVNGALDALAVLGARLPGDGADKTDLDAVWMLLHHLALPGIPARWISQTAGRRDSPDRCAATAWSHVPEVIRARIRDGYAGVLAERVAATAPPSALPPPPPPPERGTVRTTHHVRTGCLLCGTPHVEVPAVRVTRLGGPVRAALAVWTPMTFTAGPDRVGGYLCPDCLRAKESVPAWGPGLFEFAYTRHLEATGRHDDARSLRNSIAADRPPELPPFGLVHHRAATSGGTPPAAPSVAWGHLDRTGR